MKLGVFSDTIGGASPEEVAERTRAAGVETVQLRLAWPGLDVVGSAGDRARLRRAYEAMGVEIAALAAYTNLLDPRPERRQANRRSMADLISVAAEFGTRVLVTETGTYDATDTWSDHPHNHTPEAWSELIAVTEEMARRCERAGVTLAYEPYVNNVVDSPRAAGRLAEEINTPSLAFVFDAAGLTTARTVADNRAITREVLTLLRGRIALAHADDVRYDGDAPRWLPLGWGDLDADAVLAGLAEAGFDGALIVEHLSEALVPEALAFCRARLANPTAGAPGTTARQVEL